MKPIICQAVLDDGHSKIGQGDPCPRTATWIGRVRCPAGHLNTDFVCDEHHDVSLYGRAWFVCNSCGIVLPEAPTEWSRL